VSTKQRGGRRRRAEATASKRNVNYHDLRNPFPPLGMKVLLPEAIEIYRKGGARVLEDMVYIGRDIVEAALATAPKSIEGKAGIRQKDLTFELGRMVFQPGAGAPHATDLVRGRRPGSGQDYIEYTKLNQHFDVLQMLSPSVEPQDVPTHLRHYFTTETQLTQSNKFPFVFSRGTPQVMECFEMLRDFRGVSDAQFAADPYCYTIINTNSPRTLDIPMAQGLIDFAKMGQMSIVTPFTLMGAMAPITVAGAVTLSHAEALAAITLTQLVTPGAPICYGTFTSNVDMKSGAPAFGTPTHFQASLAAGQMARLTGLPWRSAAGSASNINDVQAANENQMGLWGCLMAGAQAGSDEIGFDNALSHVEPSGHFFAAPQTMARYDTEFYEPIVHDYANFGTWTDRGGRDASTRATDVWQEIVARPSAVAVDGDRLDALQGYIAKRTAAGGAPPES